MTLASKNSSVVGHDLDQDQDGPLPRRTRQPRRAKADRGLPPDAELTTLAADYCDHQAKLWPQLAKRGLLPSASPETLAAMVVDFVERHRTGRVDPRIVPEFPKLCPKIGGSYNRYSCDNSSPTSINDQMVNSLRKACEEKRFVPWSYVFCDYSVSGLDSSRQGYASYKGILRDPKQMIETTYIDDFTRASRDELEWWRLARLSKRLRKRMIGASDGFDLNSPDWDVKITIYGLVSRLFLKGLREKPKRGMRGAARRGTCIGRPPLGLTRRLCRDSNGNVVVGRGGKAKYVPCIDPASKDHALLVFDLNTQKKWSRCRIARHFNEQRIEGSDRWTAQSIRYILSNPAYVGVFIWNQYRTEYDPEEERWTRIRNPRSEWEIYIDKSLALIPLNVWKQARRQIGLSRRRNPKTGKKASRNQNSATTLFSGTLFCGYCGEELTLYRSDGKYKLMGCKNGPGRRCECKLTTSKSTRIIEGALLKYIADAILSDANLADFVGKVNSMLALEASRPRRDVNPLNARVAKLQKKNRNLLATIGDEDDADVRQAYHQEVKKNRKTITELTTEIERAGSGLNEVLSSDAEAADQVPLVKDAPQLFVDLDHVENLDNVRQVFHAAEKHPDNPVLRKVKPWETDRGTWGSVLYDEQEKIFKAWYGGKSGRKKEYRPGSLSECNVLCYATSLDGIHWDRPVLGLHEVMGTRQNNVVVGDDHHNGLGHWESTLKDPLETDPRRRYKALGWSSYDWDGPLSGIYSMTSPDGMRWTHTPEPVFHFHPRKGSNDLGPVGDAQSLMIDTLRRRYVACLRSSPHRSQSVSQDFIMWTPPRVQLRARLREIANTVYNHMGFVYGDRYLGLLTYFDRDPKDPLVTVRLLTSRDGETWQRPETGQPLIDVGAIGEWDRFLIMLTGAPPVRVGDKLYVYYRGMAARHKPYEGKDDAFHQGGGLGLATLRLDGFASLDSSYDGGRVTTKPFRTHGRQLRVNAKADCGRLRVEVLDNSGHALPGFGRDDCRVMQVDRVDEPMGWKENVSLDMLKDRPIQLRFHLENARLYAYRIA